MKRPRLALLLILASIAATGSPTDAQAYPIFYKCNADRSLSDVLTGADLQNKLKAYLGLSAQQQREWLSTECKGLKECERNLGQIMALAQLDRALVNKIFAEELEQLNHTAAASPIQELKSESFQLMEAIQSNAFRLAACQNTIEALPPEKFLLGSGDERSVLVYFPYFSEYTYATGCRPYSDTNLSCSPNWEVGLKESIQKALLGGADPYVYLAIGLMEDGANGWDSLYLDPIGKMKAMGCREEAGNTSKKEKGKLYSFGNFHKIAEGTVRDPALSGRIKKFVTGMGTSVKPGKSYFCRNVIDAREKLVTSPERGNCCLELDFSAGINPAHHTDDSGPALLAIDQAFTTEHVRQVQSRQLSGKRDPAFRLQQFNGFSRLMGGAEQVSTFRSGVNYYEDPAYGYQAMDYIINSLMTNPWIRSEVERQSKELKIRTPSILCLDVPVPGTYQLDSHAYFKKHRDSPRLKVIQGKPLAAMSRREKTVFMQELMDPAVTAQLEKRLGKLPMVLQSAGPPKLMNVMDVKLKDGSGYSISKPVDPEGPPPEGDQHPLASVFDSEKARKGFTLDVGGTKRAITYFGDHSPTAADLDLAAIGSGGAGAPPGEYRILFKDGNAIQVSKGAVVDPSTAGWINFNQDFRVEFQNGGGYEVKVQNNPSAGTQSAVPTPTAMGGGMIGMPMLGMGMQMGSPYQHLTPQMKVEFHDGTGFSVTTKQKYHKPAKKTAQTAPSSDLEQFVRAYWSEIYPSRDTISEASPLPWTEMPDSALAKIGQRLRTETELRNLKAAKQPQKQISCPDCGDPDKSDLDKSIIDELKSKLKLLKKEL